MWQRLRGNLALVGAVALLIWAAVRPTLQEGRYQAEVHELASLVTEMTDATETQLQAAGSWPATAEPGVAPDGTAGRFGGAALTTEHAVLQWRLLVVSSAQETVPEDLPPEASSLTVTDSIAAVLVTVPFEVGAVVVHSADERLLAEMLARYGPDESFVRDTTWTLVLTGESDPGS